MCANTGYDSVGVATSLICVKTRNCSEKEPTVWFSDSITRGIHGETDVQERSLAMTERQSGAGGAWAGRKPEQLLPELAHPDRAALHKRTLTHMARRVRRTCEGEAEPAT